MPQLNLGDLVVIQPTDDSGDIQLDVTESYDVGASAKLSTRPVDNGTSVSDHYQVQNKTVSFSGAVVSFNGFSTKSDKSPTEYIQAIENLMKGAVLCTIVLPSSPSITECVVSSFSYTKDKNIGNGLNVNISFTQIILAERAIGILAVPTTDFANKTQEQTNNGAVKKKEVVGGFSNVTGTNLITL